MLEPHALSSTTSLEALSQADREELNRLGITAVPATRFEWRGYRYTNVSDAIAAARRAEANRART